MKLSKPISVLERMNLEDMYQQSMNAYHDIVHSAKSKTIEELYTESFKPAKTGEYLTTVKSLEDGSPHVVGLKEIVSDKIMGTYSQREYQYHLTDIDTLGLLGIKSFRIDKNSGMDAVFIPGWIESYKNDLYSGAQIRLLQAACEEANARGIDIMPLDSMPQAVKFHTMMGFRPNESFGVEVCCVEDAKNAADSIFSERGTLGQIPHRPILSKKDETYYLDRNRTVYYTAMQYCSELMSKTGKKHLKIGDVVDQQEVKMTLKGKEYNEWLDRLKGFEILPTKEK